MKLSATQHRALLKLLAYNPSGASSYELQESLATMQALARRDLARKKAGLGSIWSPQTAIEFFITAKGMAQLKGGEDEKGSI